MTREYRHYGTVELVMDPYPAAIGGQMGGTIAVPRLRAHDLITPGAEVTVTLECIYTYVSGSGKNRSRVEKILWAERGTPQIEAAGPGVRLAFSFDLPEDLPEADAIAVVGFRGHTKVQTNLSRFSHGYFAGTSLM